nr:hypothetical protein [Tanacetum cinerariifolium]
MPRVTTCVVPRGLPAVSAPSPELPVNDGQQWQSMVANDGQRWWTTVSHREPRQTTAGPPPDHRRTTVEPSLDHQDHLVELRLFRLIKYNLTLVSFQIRSRRPWRLFEPILIQRLVLRKIGDEPSVFDEQLVVDMIDDEQVLHKIAVKEKVNRIVEQLVKAVGDTEIDCIEIVDYCSMEV